MRVTFLLGKDTLSEHVFSRAATNPGVGGTQFTTIQLAIRLAEAHPDWAVTIVNVSPVHIESCPANLTTTVSASTDAYLASGDARTQDVLVAPVRTLMRVDRDHLRAHEARTIAWSRHPSDSPLRELDRSVKLAAVVSVGHYQYYTNRCLRAPAFYIQNVFAPPELSPDMPTLPPGGRGLRFVHLGALVWGKGFHHIAAQWPALRRRFPDASLEVIGSSGVYRSTEQHPLVPTERDFAEEILTHLPPDDLESGRVTFHGNLGAEKFDVIRRCHVALLNPTGRSEAFPASPLECLWAGRPVVASAGHGMWDSMRFFPELAIDGPDQIADRVAMATASEQRYAQLIERGREVATMYTSRTPEVLQRWEALLVAVARSAASDADVAAPLPRPDNHRRLYLRSFRRTTRHRIVHSPVGDAYRAVRGRSRRDHRNERRRVDHVL